MSRASIPIIESLVQRMDQSGASESAWSEKAPEEVVSKLRQVLLEVDRAPFRGVALDEMQLRFLSNATLAAGLIGDVVQPAWFEALERMLAGGQVDLPPICTLSCGLSHMKFDRCMLLQLPSEEQCPEPEPVINALNSLTSSNDGMQHWILDMSACRALKPSLLAYLLGFQHALRDRGRLVVLWLRHEAVPESLLPSVRKSFNAQSKGAFLLTDSRTL
jgi:hypothetical protein